MNIKALVSGGVIPLITKIFNKSLHNSSIFNTAVCSSKSLIGVLSDGSQVKFWKHTTEWKAMANFDFVDEQPICIDIHPSSF